MAFYRIPLNLGHLAEQFSGLITLEDEIPRACFRKQDPPQVAFGPIILNSLPRPIYIVFVFSVRGGKREAAMSSDRTCVRLRVDVGEDPLHPEGSC